MFLSQIKVNNKVAMVAVVIHDRKMSSLSDKLWLQQMIGYSVIKHL